MRDNAENHADAADRTVKNIGRKTRKRYSSEDNIRIVLAGLRGEDTIVLEEFRGQTAEGHEAFWIGRQSVKLAPIPTSKIR